MIGVKENSAVTQVGHGSNAALFRKAKKKKISIISMLRHVEISSLTFSAIA